MKQAFAALAVAVMAAVPLVAGCGADDPASLSPEAIAHAAQRTSEADGARVAIDMTMTGPDGQGIEMSGRGVVDMARQRGRIVFGLPGGGEMEQIFDGFVMWMRSEKFEGPITDGADWIKVDMQKASKAIGFDIGQTAMAGNDPTKMLEYLEVVGEVEERGDSEVRGVATTRYEATVDFRRYPRAVPKRDRAAVRKSVEKLIDLTGESEFPMEVWIDGRDLVRRIRMRMPMNVPTGDRIAIEMDYELFDFGTAIAVRPPPPDRVIDYTDVAARSARGQLR